MKTNQVTVNAFDSIVAQFLDTLDDEKHNEAWGTERSMASSVLQDLRKHLFRVELGKEERRKKYIELKKEFEPYAD